MARHHTTFLNNLPFATTCNKSLAPNCARVNMDSGTGDQIVVLLYQRR